ncbi:hypothetical protein [Curtobacterium oceanosedimentum]|uniref:Uncharacterized protein n=1 Tax=Curtobacterium oceanosedimentum TaxID=465820 RepID=A0A147DM52_9MICO|nr:hypothetical protein [Curtobacterium oceanosedimentum]KTR47315.1 hypothetical protein NS359_15215 [Curtobacterium oceanosedimentum]
MDEQREIQVRTDWQLPAGQVPSPVNQVAIAAAAPLQDGRIDSLILLLGYVAPPLVNTQASAFELDELEAQVQPIIPSAYCTLSINRARELRDVLNAILADVARNE